VDIHTQNRCWNKKNAHLIHKLLHHYVQVGVLCILNVKTIVHPLFSEDTVSSDSHVWYILQAGQ